MPVQPKYRLETICLHGGQRPDSETGSRAVPIYQTTSFVFKDTAYAARLFSLEEEGDIYSRISNPTSAVVEERMAALEGGVGALLTASGQAASTLLFTTLAGQGDNIVSSASLYGGTKTLLGTVLTRFGISTRFADIRNPGSFEELIDGRTKALFVEIIGNPSGEIADLEACASLAHRNGLPLVVDNTFATPILCRPFEWGADVVFHSATKFIGGHGTSIGGVIVDGGRFAWDGGRFPEFVDPSPGYHGLRFWESFGPKTFITKCRVEGMRSLGPAPSPFNAFLFLQGLETLHLRVPRHCENALRVAAFLKSHPKISWVAYAGLPGHPAHRLAQKYLRGGFGSIFTFGVRGGGESGKKVIESVKLISHLANVGDSKTLILHPASTSHAQLSAEDQLAAGVTPDMIRISVGTENPADIVDDLEAALAAV